MFGNTFFFNSSTPLLDTYPATLAYSLRKLRTEYAGSAIRVRRSSDNAETDIGFVDNELDTASLLSHCGGGNGFITTWYDQSTNGNNTTQTTAIRQPRIVNAGVIDTTNGKPALVFDGTDDRLINASVAIAGNITYSIVATYQLPAPVSAHSLLLIPAQVGTSIVQEFIYINIDASYREIGFNRNGLTSIGNGFGVDTALANGTQVHHFFNYTGVDPNNISSYGLDINGATKSLTNSGAFGYVAEIMSIGGRNNQNVFFLNGKVQEIIVYDTDQTTNKTAIESNINSYFTIY
jgi:hypothetical protein